MLMHVCSRKGFRRPAKVGYSRSYLCEHQRRCRRRQGVHEGGYRAPRRSRGRWQAEAVDYATMGSVHVICIRHGVLLTIFRRCRLGFQELARPEPSDSLIYTVNIGEK